jgi:hypothetical protein
MILRSFGPQIDAKIHGRTSPIAVRMRLTAQNLHVENWRSVMRFEDQSAVLEWLPVDMKPARYDQPMEMARHRMNFESVTAAVKYATTTLPEGFRSNATIRIGNNVTLDWGDIERMSTG